MEAVGLTGEHVGPPTRIFHVRIRVTFDDLHRHKSRPEEFSLDALWLKEFEVQRDRMPKEPIDVNCVLTDMER